MQRYKFQDYTEVKREHVEHIILLLRELKNDEAEKAMEELCRSIRDLKDFEARLLARKILHDARYVDTGG